MKGRLLGALAVIGLFFMGFLLLSDAGERAADAPYPAAEQALRALMPEKSPAHAEESSDQSAPKSRFAAFSVCGAQGALRENSAPPVLAVGFLRAAWHAFHLSDSAG